MSFVVRTRLKLSAIGLAEDWHFALDLKLQRDRLVDDLPSAEPERVGQLNGCGSGALRNGCAESRAGIHPLFHAGGPRETGRRVLRQVGSL